MEIVGAILYLAWLGVKWGAIAAFYVAKFTIKYLSPIILCFIMFFVGGSCGTSCAGNRYEDWRKEQIQKYTHQIEVYWDETGSVTSTITVREDLNWNINGSGNCYDVYNEDDSGRDTLSTPVLPEQANKTGKTFLGLFASPSASSTKVVNANGYSIYSVKQLLNIYGKDTIVLYAVWQ